nr:hypothetical protein CKG001_07640 [Bdellovibrio sp. CKG001]
MVNLPSLWRERSLANPFREMSRHQSRIDRLLNELMELRSGELGEELSLMPSSELIEEDKNYLLKVDLPGIKKEDVKVEVEGDRLTIRAERRSEKEEKSKKRYFSEISYGSCMRSFTLPQAIDEKKVDAKFENGVLSVTIPKTAESKSKQISIH